MSIAERAQDWFQSLTPQAHSLWAKSGHEDAYLKLTQHLIDTACVAEWLWAHWVSDSLKRTLATRWNLEEEQVRRLYVFYAGTHDVGKASVSFQRLVEHRRDSYYLLRPIEEAGLSLEWPRGEGPNIKFPHGAVSAGFLKNWLRELGLPKLVSARLVSVVDAHHGFTSAPDVTKNITQALSGRNSPLDLIARELIESMAEITEIRTVFNEVTKPRADAYLLMTGLVIMADWIASNEEAFPYDVIAAQPERVEEAMQHVDLPLPWVPVDVPESLEELFDQSFGWGGQHTVRPVQQAAVDIATEAVGPTLMIIEAPTGEGKTEAGLAAAYILGQKSGAQGVYVAAPTMATANGLLDRVLHWAQRSSRAGSVASMYLAHSKNRLSQQFQKLRFRGLHSDTAPSRSTSDEAEDKGALVANQWLSGSRKGLLSDFVVGTVDQVLMMALKVRFSMLRHVGLAGKVIIIDEVHAYDAYMSEYLERVLQWLASYGTSVILMSATLPPEKRHRLASSYAGVLLNDANPPSPLLDARSYPLISVVDNNGIRAADVPARPDDATIAVHQLDDRLSTLSNTLSNLLDDGGVALIICNTIRRAQETYRELQNHFPGEVELHHSAFIASHRSEKEDVLRDMLGPNARRGEGRPLRRIIVATQVAEQSLDIDADVLVTDIAPIDLIIQRAGRIHRHARPTDDRPEKLREPKVFIRALEYDGGIPHFDGGAKAIYGEALLLATLAYLPDTIRRPSDVPDLVRKVYSKNPQFADGLRERWEKASNDEESKKAEAASRAGTFLFGAPSGTARLSDLFDVVHDDFSEASGERRGNAQVRDSEFSIEVIAIETTDHGYCAFGSTTEVLVGNEPTYSQAIELASSSLRLPAWITRAEKDFDPVINELEANTPIEWSNSGLLRGQLALKFDDSGISHIGRFILTYDDEVGLVVTVDSP